MAQYDELRAEYLSILNMVDDPNFSNEQLRELVFSVNQNTELELKVPGFSPVVVNLWADSLARPATITDGTVVVGFNVDTGHFDVGVGGVADAPTWYNATLTAE